MATNYLYGTQECPIENPKLPKQMKHWFAEFGITLNRYGYARSARKEYRVTLAQRYRHFRVLPHIGLIQICDGFMDRWANSVGAEAPLPKSRAEFVATMQGLLSGAKHAEVSLEAQQVTVDSFIEEANQNFDDFVELNKHDLDLIARYGCENKFDRRLVRRYEVARKRRNSEVKYWTRCHQMLHAMGNPSSETSCRN